MMVVRLECRVRFLVEGRVCLPLHKRLTFGLRRAKTRYLDSCLGIHPSKDATPVFDAQGSTQHPQQCISIHPGIIPTASGADRAGLGPSDRDITWSYPGSCIRSSENRILSSCVN